MIILKSAKNSLKKFTKGIFLCFSILIATGIIVQSCKKTDIALKDNAAENFLSVLKEQSKIIRNISVNPTNTKVLNPTNANSLSYSKENLKNNSFSNYTKSNSEYLNNENQNAFITFDRMPINPNYSYDINGMANLITNYNGVFSNTPSDNYLQFTVTLENVNNSLQPLISEAKVYLNARGLSNADITEMIIEEGGQEVDLVPYAVALAEYEKYGSGTAKVNYQSLFFNSAYATPSVLHCAGVALGIDALWALGGSNAASWTKHAMKKAFGAVAKRALGPIGAAICVASFTLCMYDLLP